MTQASRNSVVWLGGLVILLVAFCWLLRRMDRSVRPPDAAPESLPVLPQSLTRPVGDAASSAADASLLLHPDPGLLHRYRFRPQSGRR